MRAEAGSFMKGLFMRDDLTDITVVLDRSGSMSACREEAENGFNHFVAEQAKRPGQAVLTLVQFDTEYEFVHRAVPIGAVPKFSLVPRGSTALLDAVGRAINETGARIRDMPESDRPGLVVFVILTDGLENSSREFSGPKVKQMIEHQEQVYSWQFTYLGANQDAFAEAAKLGIKAEGATPYAAKDAGLAFCAAERKLGRMRMSKQQGEKVENAFTDEERAMIDKK